MSLETMNLKGSENEKHAEWLKFLETVGTKVEVVLLGKCPVCGGDINLETKAPIHNCPRFPKQERRSEVKSIVTEDRTILIGQKDKVIPVANQVSNDYGVWPIVITE